MKEKEAVVEGLETLAVYLRTRTGRPGKLSATICLNSYWSDSGEFLGVRVCDEPSMPMDLEDLSPDLETALEKRLTEYLGMADTGRAQMLEKLEAIDERRSFLSKTLERFRTE